MTIHEMSRIAYAGWHKIKTSIGPSFQVSQGEVGTQNPRIAIAVGEKLTIRPLKLVNYFLFVRLKNSLMPVQNR
jgi:hypothetical protein